MRATVTLVSLAAALAVATPAAAAPRCRTDGSRCRATASFAARAEFAARIQLRNPRGRVLLDRTVVAGGRVARALVPGAYRIEVRGIAGTPACTRRLQAYNHEGLAARAGAGAGGCVVEVRQPAAFPAPARIRAARRWLARRAGLTSLGLIDTHGRFHGLLSRRVFVTASVVKAMLLVAYLRRIGARAPSRSERALLGPMIHVSDNRAAGAIYHRVGDAALRRLARRAGMRRFSVAHSWGFARFSARDQARFMRQFDLLVPRRNRAYARRLLSSIAGWQRWGFWRFSLGAGWRTFAKGGWRSTGRGRLVHEVAMFERHGRRFSMAMLTDGDPSHAYGTATLRGVAARIFGSGRRAGRAAAEAAELPPRLRRAGLVDVRRYAPDVLVDLRYGTRRNITGRRLPGYCRQWPLLLRRPARSLAEVDRDLARRGLGLKVLDAYRPARASRALVRWAHRTGRGRLVGRYIARRSRHNLGSAVDLTLVRRSDGRQLPMGTRYDHLGARAHTLNARGRTLRNRLILRDAMRRHGFRPYWREWWHFEHLSGGRRYLDLTIGCEN